MLKNLQRDLIDPKPPQGVTHILPRALTEKPEHTLMVRRKRKRNTPTDKADFGIKKKKQKNL